jgi:hypothetical protein
MSSILFNNLEKYGKKGGKRLSPLGKTLADIVGESTIVGWCLLLLIF